MLIRIGKASWSFAVRSLAFSRATRSESSLAAPFPTQAFATEHLTHVGGCYPDRPFLLLMDVPHAVSKCRICPTALSNNGSIAEAQRINSFDTVFAPA